MIKATIVADSIAPTGDRLTTLEIVFPRYILAELNTHRLFTKNSASSRAIPLRKMLLEAINNPFIPYAFQQDHKGMQGTTYFREDYQFSLIEFMDKAKEFINGVDNDDSLDLYINVLNQYKHKKLTLKEWWLVARDKAVEMVAIFGIFGVTKQLANRLLEPFMYHKVLISATEWENFFNLRCPDYRVGHNDNKFKSWKDVLKVVDFERETIEEPIAFPLMHNKGQADIHMMFLAEAIYDAIQESEPRQLQEGEWHIPYSDNMDIEKINTLAWKHNTKNYDTYKEFNDSNYSKLVEKELQCKISIARCARLSYQTLGDNPEINYEKDLELYEVLSKSGHWSPFEHVAKVMTRDEYHTNIKGEVQYEEGEGYTIFDETVGWCRNFRGFIQYRALLD